jgi:tRNA (cmo5U34)-methyltransferase
MAIIEENGNFDAKPPVSVEEYDASIRLYCGAYEEMFKIAHACLRARLPEDANLLVVGAGTGMEICTFAPQNPGWSFCGVDPSADMLAITRRKLLGQEHSNHVELVRGYVYDLENRAEFDGATCILVMHFQKDDGSKLSLLESIARRLKKNAPLILIDGFGEPGSREFEDTTASWKQYPLMCEVPIASVEGAFRDVIMKMVRFVPEMRIKELLNQAGFSGVHRFYTAFLYGGWMGFRQ